LGVADLDEQFPATLLDVPLENVVAVLGDPDEVDCETCDGMIAMSIGVGHSDPSYGVEKNGSTESGCAKAQGFNRGGDIECHHHQVSHYFPHLIV
jgi:hypothetical protein